MAEAVRKGVRTRERIVRSAAELFNRQGYAATSVSDILASANIEKGGLYRHFSSKDALIAAAFTYAAETAAAHHSARWAGVTMAERLGGVVASFGALVDAEPSAGPVGGGCPLFNAAVESDDGDATLRAFASMALSRFHDAVAQMVRDGIAARSCRDSVDPDEVATVLVALLEGALVLTRVHGDRAHLARAAKHARAYIGTLAP